MVGQKVGSSNFLRPLGMGSRYCRAMPRDRCSTASISRPNWAAVTGAAAAGVGAAAAPWLRALVAPPLGAAAAAAVAAVWMRDANSMSARTSGSIVSINSSSCTRRPRGSGLLPARVSN